MLGPKEGVYISQPSPPWMKMIVFNVILFRLIKGDKYLISELYEDGWCKGKNLRTGDIGVCPSNHLRRYSCKQVQLTTRVRTALRTLEIILENVCISMGKLFCFLSLFGQTLLTS